MTESAQSKGYGRDQVVEIVNSVISKVERGAGVDRAIYEQLQALKSIIDDARKELGTMRSADIQEKHIPTATDELDAIISATAEATGTIMDACEAIEEKAATTNVGDEVNAEITKIYEACSFQDITGQRISKVVSTLRDIEDKVAKLLAVVGDSVPAMDISDEGEGEKDGDASLLNGPQLEGQGVSQDEIDRLLAEFD